MTTTTSKLKELGFECRSSHPTMGFGSSCNAGDKFTFLVVRDKLPMVRCVSEYSDSGESSLQLIGSPDFMYEVLDLCLGYGETESEAWDSAVMYWENGSSNHYSSESSFLP
jgi:hypothetical protein